MEGQSNSPSIKIRLKTGDGMLKKSPSMLRSRSDSSHHRLLQSRYYRPEPARSPTNTPAEKKGAKKMQLDSSRNALRT